MISKPLFCAITLALSTLTNGAPALYPRASNTTTGFSQMQNGLDAQKLNAQFATLTANSTCTDGDQACVAGSFSQCIGSTWALQACSSGLSCFALPLVTKAGTSLACDTLSDAQARFVAAGVSGGVSGNGTTTTNTTNPATTDPGSGGDDGDCEDPQPTAMTSATSSMATTLSTASPSGSPALKLNRRQYTDISYGPTFGFSSPTTTSAASSASSATNSVIPSGTASPTASLPTISTTPVPTLTPTSSFVTGSVPPVTTQSGLPGGSPSGSVGPNSTAPTPVTTVTGSNGIPTVTVVSTVFVTVTENPCTLPTATPTTTGTGALTSPTPAYINNPSTPSAQPSYAPVTTINLNSPTASGATTPTATATPSLAAVSQVTPSASMSGAAVAIPTTTTASSPFNFVSATY